MQKSEEVLLEEIRNGNKKSFELLIIKYEKPIFNLIYNFVKETDVVSELAQETFLKAFKSIKSFKGNSTFYTWLRRIAINNSINYLNTRNQFLLEAEIEENNFSRSLGDNKFYTPENSVILEETSLAIKEALDSLPDRLRIILIMREFEDMSYEEIAEVLQCPIGTVRSRLFHARRILKEKLEHFI